MMEGKELNLNQPFLSVRRPLIPYYKSELKSGPVVKEGAVPFHWEQTPGKPRQETTATTVIENKAKNAEHLRSASAPKLPPVRYLNPILQECRQVSPKINASNVDSFERFECPKENAEEYGNDRNCNEEEEDDDDDDDYMDALDTLSRTNSTFLNCSMSGVSGLEDSDVKPCRDFTRDPNTLNLVMDRFLPAAKAMVSHKPLYLPKKAMVVRGEESKDLAKKTVTKKEDGDKPSLRYSPSYADHYSYYHGKDEDSADDDDDDDHSQGSLIPSVCGLLPRFCLKGSSGMLTAVPGMSVRTRIAKSHGNKVRNRSPSNCPDPEIGDGFQHEDCDIKQADTTRTILIEENETITGIKPPKKVSKTFAQLLKDEDGLEDLGSEKVLPFDTIHTVDNQSLPNELLRSRDDEDRSHEEHIDSPSEDPKNLKLMDVSNNSTAADDIEVEPKKSEVLEKKISELIISPPLPKSPSDSWLWRTLPSASGKNIHRRSNLGRDRNTQNLNPKVPEGGSMWEAIVKSSKQQHDNSHHPEESLTPLQKT